MCTPHGSIIFVLFRCIYRCIYRCPSLCFNAPPPPTALLPKQRHLKDFGLGVGVSELVVARSGMDESTGGYQYTVVFLEETDDVPQMLVGSRS